MVKFIEFFSEPRPFLLAALVCAFLAYCGTGILKERSPYKSAIPLQEAQFLSGKICTNPCKTSSGKFYSAKLALVSCKSSQITCKSGTGIEQSFKSSGKINILIPSKTVEALYPGKLYSLEGKSVLIEQGENISCKGKWNPKANAFTVHSLEYMEPDKSLSGKIAHFRAKCRLVFKRMLFGWGNAGGLILSLLSGAREYTESGLCNDFSLAGLSHVLALSGMHLSFFSGLSGILGKRIFGKRTSFFVRMAAIIAFSWFAGLSPSLLRALLCSSFILFANSFYCKKLKSSEILSAVFLIHIVIIPDDAKSVAFMLSYSALAGIMAITPLIERFFTRKIPPALSSPLCTSIGAQAATTPITAAFFGTITPIGIISSVAVCPLISIFLSLALFCIAICLLMPFLCPPFGCILNMAYEAIVFLVRIFARVPPIQLK